jgi:hypothetical protein
MFSQVVSGFELPAVLAVGAEKVGIAKLANGLRSIRFSPGPEVAVAETAENGRAAGMKPFSLQ